MSSKVHSRCVQLSISRIADAWSVFSQKNDSGQIPLVLVPEHRSAFSPGGWWMTIPTGCFCLMQYFGKDIGVAQPGGSIKPPYYRVAYVVSQQSCTYNAPVKDCPTSDNVRVGVDVVIVFAIRDPQKFVYKLGAAHFDKLLSGAVDEGVRLLVRSQSHQGVRTLRGSRADALLTSLNNKFKDGGVTFSNCTITAVILPQSLEVSLEHTTELRKKMEKMNRDHEYHMGEIQRASALEVEELAKKSEQAIVMETGKKKRAELNLEQRMVKADEERSTAMIEAQTQGQVGKMEATSALERTKVNLERARVEAISKAEAEAEARRVQADIGFESSQMNAEAEKQRLLGQAEAIKLDAQAEAKASQHLTQKRKHELDMREKEVLKELAEKANYNLIGEPGDRLVDAIMTGHLTGNSTKGSGSWFK